MWKLRTSVIVMGLVGHAPFVSNPRHHQQEFLSALEQTESEDLGDEPAGLRPEPVGQAAKVAHGARGRLVAYLTKLRPPRPNHDRIGYPAGDRVGAGLPVERRGECTGTDQVIREERLARPGIEQRPRPVTISIHAHPLQVGLERIFVHS